MMPAMFDNAWIWMIIGVMIMGLEIIIPGVYLMWIGIGAVVTGLILTLAPDLTLAWQILIFAVAMTAALGLGFFVQQQSQATVKGVGLLNRELEAMIGTRHVAVCDFRLGRGRIRVGDTTYGAVGEDGIVQGTTVEVRRVENGDIIVAKVHASTSSEP